MLIDQSFARVGFDAIAVKLTECDVARLPAPAVDTVAIDYEGRDHLPSTETLERLAEQATVYLTTPVRADGFDPLGDNTLVDWIPDGVERVFVAGNPAYLSDEERSRAIAPRLSAALESSSQRPWVGTEGIERLAITAGGVQYELLSQHTRADVRALRAVGFEGSIAVYAPTVLSENDDVILDAVGGYVSRRQRVRRALAKAAASAGTDAESLATDRHASGRARDILLTAARDFALVGNSNTISDRITALHEAGVDMVVGYPATFG